MIKAWNYNTNYNSSMIKGTAMQIEKALIKDCLRASKVSWKFYIPTIYNFAVIFPWNLLFSLLFINKTLRLNNLKIRRSMSVKFLCLLFVLKRSYILHNLRNCTLSLQMKHESTTENLARFTENYLQARKFVMKRTISK